MGIPLIDYGDLTPEIRFLIGLPEPVFEPVRAADESEYSRDTSTWD